MHHPLNAPAQGCVPLTWDPSACARPRSSRGTWSSAGAGAAQIRREEDVVANSDSAKGRRSGRQRPRVQPAPVHGRAPCTGQRVARAHAASRTGARPSRRSDGRPRLILSMSPPAPSLFCSSCQRRHRWGSASHPPSDRIRACKPGPRSHFTKAQTSRRSTTRAAPSSAPRSHHARYLPEAKRGWNALASDRLATRDRCAGALSVSFR